MTYATQQDLIDRFGEEEIINRTDRSGTGSIDATVVDLALADADDEINGYLGQQYELPLASVPSLLNRLAADIARYRLYDDAASDEVRNRYKDAVSLLTSIARGNVSLGMPSTGPADTGEAVTVTPAAGSVWGRSGNGGLR